MPSQTGNRAPWHTHLYRAVRSALGDPRCVPTRRLPRKSAEPWQAHVRRGVRSFVEPSDRPWHTHFYRAYQAFRYGSQPRPPEPVSADEFLLGVLRRSLPVALRRLREQQETRSTSPVASTAGLAAALSAIEADHRKLTDGHFANTPENRAVARELPRRLRALRRALSPRSEAGGGPVALGKHPSFSIVINTLNRAQSLARTLDSLQWLNYEGEFEVIVVNGPSTDDTNAVLQRRAHAIRIGRVAEANLSISRNRGITMARGDIVAFLDDDAIPEPEWLRDLAAAYQDPEVGAAGGLVYFPSGRELQAGFTLIDRLADPDFSRKHPFPELCFPHSWKTPHLLGANCSFRRDVLRELGGFDEEYEYHLDETDLQLRLIDAGYVIALFDGAHVHHKYEPSSVRNAQRFTHDYFTILKNKIYFTQRHSREHCTPDEIERSWQNLLLEKRQSFDRAVADGVATPQQRQKLEHDALHAPAPGLARAALPPRLMSADPRSGTGEGFKPFPVKIRRDAITVVFVSSRLPPEDVGDIGRFTLDTAEALAAAGHLIHIVASTQGVSRIDIENGVWIHRLNLRGAPLPELPCPASLPHSLWAWSARAYAETRQIAARRPVHVVEAPVWACEGAAFLEHPSWPLVTSVHAPMRAWLDSHPARQNDAAWMDIVGRPTMEMEAKLMRLSHGVRANNEAVRRYIERRYDLRLPSPGTLSIHHTLKDAAPDDLKTEESIRLYEIAAARHAQAAHSSLSDPFSLSVSTTQP